MKLMIAIFAALLLSGCSSNLQLEHYKAYRQHQYVSDQQQYGKLDVWSADLKGDCEDYALYMKQRVGGNLLHVSTQQGESHMVLDVNGTIIDNLSKRVYPRSEMTHKVVYQLTEEHIKQFLLRRGVK